jgi:hypothetical protein
MERVTLGRVRRWRSVVSCARSTTNPGCGDLGGTDALDRGMISSMGAGMTSRYRLTCAARYGTRSVGHLPGGGHASVRRTRPRAPAAAFD